MRQDGRPMIHICRLPVGQVFHELEAPTFGGYPHQSELHWRQHRLTILWKQPGIMRVAVNRTQRIMDPHIGDAARERGACHANGVLGLTVNNRRLHRQRDPYASCVAGSGRPAIEGRPIPSDQAPHTPCGAPRRFASSIFMTGFNIFRSYGPQPGVLGPASGCRSRRATPSGGSASSPPRICPAGQQSSRDPHPLADRATLRRAHRVGIACSAQLPCKTCRS